MKRAAGVIDKLDNKSTIVWSMGQHIMLNRNVPVDEKSLAVIDKLDNRSTQDFHGC